MYQSDYMPVPPMYKRTIDFTMQEVYNVIPMKTTSILITTKYDEKLHHNKEIKYFTSVKRKYMNSFPLSNVLYKKATYNMLHCKLTHITSLEILTIFVLIFF